MNFKKEVVCLEIASLFSLMDLLGEAGENTSFFQNHNCHFRVQKIESGKISADTMNICIKAMMQLG